jgi:hypothetical protein
LAQLAIAADAECLGTFKDWAESGGAVERPIELGT